MCSWSLPSPARGSVNTEDECRHRKAAFGAGNCGAVSDLGLCTRTTEHTGSPGIRAVAEQRIEPAPHHSGSVLSAWGLSGALISVFLRVLPAVRLETCRYLQLCHNSWLSCVLDIQRVKV